MFNLARKRLSPWAVLSALIFMIIQVFCDLNLPTLTSNMINKGVITGDIDYIWRIGGKMLIFALFSLLAASGNVFFASTQAQKFGTKLREELFTKVLSFGSHEIDQFGASSLITRTTNDVLQIQNVTIMALRMMIQSPTMLIGAGIMAYLSEPRLTTVFLISFTAPSAGRRLCHVLCCPTL